eukprot:PhF_6_TR5106/c0_g1_i1/m.7203
MNRFTILLLVAIGVAVALPPPDRFAPFLLQNTLLSGLPLSYNVYPSTFWDDIPDSLKPNNYNTSIKSPQCGNIMVSPMAMNKYEFQTERLLTSLGLNIYDAAVRCVALSLLGYWDQCVKYLTDVLVPHKTLQFPDIRGDAPCAGVVYNGECTDPEETGRCGFCYGDNIYNRSQNNQHAYFFRMITDYWDVQGTIDARCPLRNQTWKWNDYTPILGENAWATLLGTLVSAYNGTGGNVDFILDDGPELSLASQLVTMLPAMSVGDTGSFYYCPRNTWFLNKPNQGSTVSVENQASLLAGLKAYRYVLLKKSMTKYRYLVTEVEAYIDNLERFLLSAYSPSMQYFRQGGTYDPATRQFVWGQGDAPPFAVDCQTWVASVLGARLIDATYGENTTYNLWQTVKAQSGYYGPLNDSTTVRGVGYTSDSYSGSIFSGEWTFGAINWLRIMMSESDYDDGMKDALAADALSMRNAIEEELTVSVPIQNSTINTTGVLYANRRYFIPFGWWANPLQSLASTGWAVAIDNDFNPLMLDGSYASQYPL